jgi:hypothetical protein
VTVGYLGYHRHDGRLVDETGAVKVIQHAEA